MSTTAQVKTPAKTPAAPVAARIVQPPVGVPEREAERPDIAAQLEGAARLGHNLEAVSVDSPALPIIQRQGLPEEDEEELQMKRGPAAIQRQELPDEEEEELQLKPEPAALQRQELPEKGEEAELQTKPANDVQQQGRGGGFRLDDETAGRINRARGGGQPLEGALQEQMSASLGHDFSGVRVHTDTEADDLTRLLQARAFTTIPDIFFKRGEYEPYSDSGRAQLAHELSHVVQQSRGRVPGGGGGMTIRPAGDIFEHEADSVSRAASREPIGTAKRQVEGRVESQRRGGGGGGYLSLIRAGPPVAVSGPMERRSKSGNRRGAGLGAMAGAARGHTTSVEDGDVGGDTASEAHALTQAHSAAAVTIGLAGFFKRGACDPDQRGLRRPVPTPAGVSLADSLALQGLYGPQVVVSKLPPESGARSLWRWSNIQWLGESGPDTGVKLGSPEPTPRKIDQAASLVVQCDDLDDLATDLGKNDDVGNLLDRAGEGEDVSEGLGAAVGPRVQDGIRNFVFSLLSGQVQLGGDGVTARANYEVNFGEGWQGGHGVVTTPRLETLVQSLLGGDAKLEEIRATLEHEVGHGTSIAAYPAALDRAANVKIDAILEDVAEGARQGGWAAVNAGAEGTWQAESRADLIGYYLHCRGLGVFTSWPDPAERYAHLYDEPATWDHPSGEQRIGWMQELRTGMSAVRFRCLRGWGWLWPLPAPTAQQP